LENIFRLVNVSMINEMALLADRLGVDIWEVIEAASTKPYGFMPFYPGPGLGGHCIPIDPFYLSWKAKEVNFSPRFIELAGEINDMMPHYVTTKVIVALNRQKKCVNGSKILVLGVSYKKDVEDVREAPAVRIIRELWRKFALVTYCDPHVRSLSIDGKPVERVELTDEALREADCVLILTDHTAFDFDRVAEKSRLIVDTRNAITRRDLSHVYHL
jgi:UDP-N-acetyl-D-glucosamine dehydrogenase